MSCHSSGRFFLWTGITAAALLAVLTAGSYAARSRGAETPDRAAGFIGEACVDIEYQRSGNEVIVVPAKHLEGNVEVG